MGYILDSIGMVFSSLFKFLGSVFDSIEGMWGFFLGMFSIHIIYRFVLAPIFGRVFGSIYSDLSQGVYESRSARKANKAKNSKNATKGNKGKSTTNTSSGKKGKRK